jgi:uncharacterized membrane protein YcaP (DUF421 family)
METVVRVGLIYLAILVGMRFLGKREFAQLSPLELISLLLIPEIASQGLMREDFSFTNAIIGIATLLLLVLATSMLQARSERAARAIGGTPAVLVHAGRLLEHNLVTERVTPDEVLGEVRAAGYEDLGEVQWAILEADGRISVVPRADIRSRAAHKAEPIHT